jgi:ATP phosphoribosyltransferase regulatory subunit
MMSESLSRIPGGIRYYFGGEARLRRDIEHIAMSVFDGWNYEEITTPTIDYYSLFERGMGRHEAERAFRFIDVDGRMLALRPDVTSGIARAAATLMARRERPLRFSYAAPVFQLRGESRSEWRRESAQIGCELIGRNTTSADLEVLTIATEILSRVGLEESYTVTLNDLEIFNGIIEGLGLGASEREEMRRLVDTHNERDLQRFLLSYASADECQAFVNLVQLSGKIEVIESARRIITNRRSRAALDRLEALWQIIESLDLSQRFEIDLGDVSRLDYYTGLVFQIYVAGAGARVGGGGRYDQLTANFGKAEPAVGFVLELDALADALTRNGSASVSQREVKEALSLNCDKTITLFRDALERRARGERIVIDSREGARCLR